jgi:hypothetical protein
MSAILKLILKLGAEIINALSKFFTIHFVKTMTVTGCVIAFIFLLIFISSKRA